MSIDIQHVHKHFGAFHALNDVSLQVKQGELVSLLGPSGCGKTTLLRIIAGLETADEGQVILNGETATRIPVRERQVGFVFQQYALFKHMTVFDNVAFGLRMKSGAERPSRDEIKQKVMRLLEMVQLDNLAKRYPAQLSGGQRQRIALARALAVDPKVLLLDEPFGALDAQVRKDLRRWMRHLHDELNIASVFVTHDQEEALELSDRVVMMNQGQIEQVGTPREIWAQPASDFVYGFLGDVNTLEGVTEEQGLVISGLPIPVDLKQWGVGRSVRAYVRPHDIAVSVSPIENASEFSLKHSYLAGSRAYLEVQQGTTGQVLEVEMATQEFFDLDLKASQTLWVHIKKAHLLPQS